VADLGRSVNHVKALISSCPQNLCFKFHFVVGVLQSSSLTALPAFGCTNAFLCVIHIFLHLQVILLLQNVNLKTRAQTPSLRTLGCKELACALLGRISFVVLQFTILKVHFKLLQLLHQKGIFIITFSSRIMFSNIKNSDNRKEFKDVQKCHIDPNITSHNK
jgi:hypothetical protein